MDKVSGHAGVLRIPPLLRALVRADEVWLALLAAGVGVCAGLGVALINETSFLMHQHLFKLAPGMELSEAPRLVPLRAFAVPTLGGLLFGIALWILARFRPRPLVDPIEANALYGGRMSLIDSLIVVAQTAWSNGVGASVGMEAGYAQLGAGVASGAMLVGVRRVGLGAVTHSIVMRSKSGTVRYVEGHHNFAKKTFGV